jgi:hypothetical protein
VYLGCSAWDGSVVAMNSISGNFFDSWSTNIGQRYAA